ncbi:uncharacterized protein F54H12.2-like [Venturia canescens]|uniref:uncharacterized protein F54H12.2-like n=1 Tax=Venturia canescens TaxID=32260 RepID=UPI001C9C924F|nr:uncharacterized protein F54H12.2-like [Venturia canescens]
MAFLHTHSRECLKSELELFSLPPTQTTIEGSNWVHYKPISSLTDDSPIEFVVPGQGDEYIDLAHTMLSLRVQIKTPSTSLQAEGSKDAPKELPEIAPVNNLLHSMFNQVDVYLNQKLVSPPNNAYAYRAYIETLLNYGPAAKKSHLTSVLWSDDTPGKMDDTSFKNNIGLRERAKLLSAGKTVDLIGHLHCNIFNQERFLLNGVEMRLRLVRARDSFCLMSSQPDISCGLNISEATLLVRRTKIAPGVLLSHARALAKTTAKYPLTRVEVKAISLHGGVHGETIDNIVLGQLPKRIIIGFVDNRAYNGNVQMNPFNFQNYKINYLSLYVDGAQVPSRPLQPDFTQNNLYIGAYHTLFSGTGIHFLNEGNSINRENYPKGYCLFAFDLTPDLSANTSSHWNLVKHGSVRIEVRFAEALASTVNCIVYAEYDNVLEIDASRQVIADFSG